MIGQKIKELRLKKGLTQTGLAELIGTTQVSVCRWENGTHTAQFCNVHKIAKALKVNILELI